MLGKNSATAPIDTDVLDRQTFGDRALKSEILALFVEQATLLHDFVTMGQNSAALAAHLHRFKGSARAVGAVRAAQEADRLERQLDSDPAGIADASRTEPLRSALAEVCRFAATLGPGSD